METQQRSATDLLSEVLRVENVDQVIAFGKDGFVIESVGGGRAEDVEQLGATLASAVNEMDKLGRITKCGDLDNITISFRESVVLAMATSNAVITAISSDNTSLGFLRIKMNSLMPDFEQQL